MSNKANALAHTKWMCKYHIVFTPKYRRKIIYNQYRKDLGKILRELCRYKGVEILEGHLMPDHLFQKGNDGAAVGDDIDGVVRLTFFL